MELRVRTSLLTTLPPRPSPTPVKLLGEVRGGLRGGGDALRESAGQRGVHPGPLSGASKISLKISKRRLGDAERVAEYFEARSVSDSSGRVSGTPHRQSRTRRRTAAEARRSLVRCALLRIAAKFVANPQANLRGRPTRGAPRAPRTCRGWMTWRRRASRCCWTSARGASRARIPPKNRVRVLPLR